MKEIDGDLIDLAKKGHFDVITHGCNCFCTMGAGIAPQMANAFGCDAFPMENHKYRGDINKLGTIDYQSQLITPIMKPLKIAGVEIQSPDFGGHPIIVVNSYTQFRYGPNHADGNKMPVDYDAIRLCMRKINYLFAGKIIGLPKIGAGLAGGDWNIIREIIIEELPRLDICIVNYKNKHMDPKPFINPIVEELINSDSEDKKILFDRMNDGEPFYIGNRKYRIVSR